MNALDTRAPGPMLIPVDHDPFADPMSDLAQRAEALRRALDGSGDLALMAVDHDPFAGAPA